MSGKVPSISREEGELFIVMDGVKIAKRCDKLWQPLEPGWSVQGGENEHEFKVCFDPAGCTVH